MLIGVKQIGDVLMIVRAEATNGDIVKVYVLGVNNLT